MQYANLRLDVEISSPSASYWYLMYMVETAGWQRGENIAHGGMPSGCSGVMHNFEQGVITFFILKVCHYVVTHPD
jgi:hypothetical protein